MTHDRHLLRKIICEALEDAGLARQTKAQRGPLIELALGFTWNWAGHLEIVGDDVVKEFLGNASLNWHKDLMRELHGAAGPVSVAALRPLTMSGPILIGKDAPLLEIQDIKNALGIDLQEEVPITGAWRISLLPMSADVRPRSSSSVGPWFNARCDIVLKNDDTGVKVQGTFTDPSSYAKLPSDTDSLFSREMGSSLIKLIIPALSVISVIRR
jgi:hypothetical protein